MNQKYVVSLELAQEMKELGFPQESDYWWYKNPVTGEWELVKMIASVPEAEVCSAYHVGELGEMLPSIVSMITIDKNSVADEFLYRLFIHKDNEDDWVVRYEAIDEDIHYQSQDIFFFNEKLCESMTEMLIYLAKNNFIDPSNL